MARPIEFNRTLVLDRATRAFWNKGYCATSMANLVTETKLKPGSLYAAFSSKEGLFLATLDHYGLRNVETIRRTLTDPKSPLEGVRTFLRQLATDAATDVDHSCFLVNSALEVARHNAEIRERVKVHLDAVRGLFRDALADARDQGELPLSKDPETLATLIMANIFGIRVLLAAGSEPQEIQGIVDQVLTLLD